MWGLTWGLPNVPRRGSQDEDKEEGDYPQKHKNPGSKGPQKGRSDSTVTP